MASDEQRLHIGGVPLKFPFKPYPTQLSMMAKIIQALNKKENALLESPTGSGKSLALLCASLAWQKSMYEKMRAESAGPCPCFCHTSSCGAPALKDCSLSELNSSVAAISTGLADPIGLASQSVTFVAGATNSTVMPAEGRSVDVSKGSIVPPFAGPLGDMQQDLKANSKGSLDAADDSDFKPAVKRYRRLSPDRMAKQKVGEKKGIVYTDPPSPSCDTQPPPCENGLPTWKMKLKNGPQASSSHSNPKSEDGYYNPHRIPGCHSCSCNMDAKHKDLPQAKTPMDRNCSPVPKIYVCTRTHKQIAQLVRELSRTSYSNTLMTILASRDHTCINPVVADSHNKSEECTLLLRDVHGPSCSWFNRVQTHMGTHAQLISRGLCTAWDIEDLVALGKKTRACPYFASRNLLSTADVVFCPYNYVIDPNIRTQMGLDIRGHVIILDEAHNMEDSAREAASLTLTSDQLLDVSNEIHHLMELPSTTDEKKESYGCLMALCHNMAQWMEDTSSSLPQRGFEETCGIWSGSELAAILRGLGVMDTTLPLLQGAYGTISDLAEQQTDIRASDVMSTVSLSCLRSILIVYNFMFKEGQKYFNDYRVCLMRTTTFIKKDRPNGWRGKKSRNAHVEKVWVVNLHFWCMNPAVAFTGLLGAHSIILTSGTLSPIHSFSSELGVDFPIQLEANHVVPEAQTWIYSISSGPGGHCLLANFQNSETYEFQDEVGAVLERVCMTVPFGILCFLPSYKMLEKLVAQWKQTDQWERISRRKVIISEPRSGERTDFNATMDDFYRVIENSHAHQPGGEEESGCDGALFLAVCRGKVSEGLDFADNNARAVITIGIPFPNFKDKQVELKREYNTSHSHSRGLLSGSEWYEIQAYRAVNQALGRCIRHVKDWGALVLVDDRFGKGQNYTKGLSRWVRTRLGHHTDFTAAISSLKRFVEERITHDSDTILYPLRTIPSDPLHHPSSPLGTIPSDPLLHPSSPLPSVVYQLPSTHPAAHTSLPSINSSPSHPNTHDDVKKEQSITGLKQNTSATGLVDVPTTTDQKVLVAEGDLMDVPNTSGQRGSSDIDSARHEGLRLLHPAIPPRDGPFSSVSSPLLFESAPSICSSPTTAPQKPLCFSPTTAPQKPLCSSPTTAPQKPLCSSPTTAPQKPLCSSPTTAPQKPLCFSPTTAPQKPLCFSPTPAPEKALHSVSIVCQGQSLLSETLGNSDDNDVTPPLSPQRQRSPNAKAMPAEQHLLVHDHTRMSASRHPKRNVRIAKVKSCGDSTECERLRTIPVQHAQIRCSCNESLCLGQVLVQTADLRSYLTEHGATDVSSSNLLSHFEDVTSPVYIANYSQMTCSFRKGSLLNAVWDSLLHLCYGLLECSRCKRILGVGIHLARDSDSLAGKSFIDSRLVELLTLSEND